MTDLDDSATASGHRSVNGDAEPRMERVADGVWAYIQPDGGWMVNNMGLIDGIDGATSIDVASTERRTRAYLDAVARVASSPVRRLVLTHSHPDHCNGASLLPDAEIIAHRNVHEDLQRTTTVGSHIFSQFEQGEVAPRTPTIVFDDALEITAGGRRVEVHHPGGPAHTTGDSYVWLPEERILFTGDLVFNGGTPFALSGSPSGWLRALERMAALAPEIVVPGHGPVGGPELLEPVAEYLRFVLGAAEDALAADVTALDAARALDLGSYAELLESERIVGNLHSAMREISGKEFDFRGAWEDMLAYNGGRPFTCHA